ncbi:uroporphyrinogen decarboxylase [Marispirochaeta aestuarii]|uniref:Uroporphyrinogen decarboxylase n=1 Tax=Marispirochaeta aestuarii TaxID=1963862 RepID=A0A1Y1S0Y1_9SPIO|nr:mandelate racemase/muconate lactonizing enzyme family protein [Marispirochaeta aestuarii]ORC37012.1 uroporphyrinogen decarboxylase [Marispirochaeta aestuarii]
MNKIDEICTSYYRVPLEEVLVDAMHGDHTHFELVVVDIICSDGLSGCGYTYTGGYGGKAIVQVIEHDLKPFLLQKDPDCIEYLWNKMNWRIHYVGRGGIAGFAISAIDIGLWDIRGKKAGLPLWKMAGGRGRTVRAYAGGIDLHYPIERLLSNTRNYLQHGFHGIKIKVGQNRLAEDVERAAAVRELIGSEKKLMIDANMRWSAAEAVRAARAMKDLDIFWLEEPTIPEDFSAYNLIRKEGGIPVAMGENLHTIYEFKDAFSIGRIDFPQPDASNIGGITGWLKIACLAEASNLPVCSHGMQELHVSLLAGTVNGGYMEVHSFPIDKYTTCPVELNENGEAVAPDVPGTGVDFNREILNAYKDPQ